MREFSSLDKLFIAKNANSKTLEDMASYLGCKPHEVKTCFENMKLTGEYDKYRVSNYEEIKKIENEKAITIKASSTKSLVDLNQILFSQLEKLNNGEFTSEELEEELAKTKAMVGVSQTMINNAKILLEADKHFNGQSKLIQSVLAAGDD